MIKPLPYLPVQGKTYTLFGESDHTRGFYLAAHTLADECLERENDIKAWLETIRGYSHKRKVLKRMAGKPTDDTRLSWCLHRSKDVFTPYTRAVDKHLESLTMKKLWDRRLGTTREQYFLHMLEIMLTNRSNKDAFLDCDQKIALLPYCLQDFSTSCQAAPDQYDQSVKSHRRSQAPAAWITARCGLRSPTACGWRAELAERTRFYVTKSIAGRRVIAADVDAASDGQAVLSIIDPVRGAAVESCDSYGQLQLPLPPYQFPLPPCQLPLPPCQLPLPPCQFPLPCLCCQSQLSSAAAGATNWVDRPSATAMTAALCSSPRPIEKRRIRRIILTSCMHPDGMSMDMLKSYLTEIERRMNRIPSRFLYL